jgi:hypothetical protein
MKSPTPLLANPWKISLWTRIRLWFVRPQYGIDWAKWPDKTVRIKAKKLDDVVYILGEEEI